MSAITRVLLALLLAASLSCSDYVDQAVDPGIGHELPQTDDLTERVVSSLPAQAVSSGDLMLSEVHLPEEMESIRERIETHRLNNHPETRVAFWAESSLHGAVFSGEDEVWPTASTIKVFILVAAYIEFREVWNEVPEELEAILNYEDGFREPLGMFSESTRDTVRNRLRNKTYRELTVSMMGNDQNVIGNSAYNASCNVLIFLLGGVEGGCSERIRSIHPGFSSVTIGRYMLEARTPENDNRNSMRSLALVCRMLASDSVQELGAADHEEIRDCFQIGTFHGYRNFSKHGHLSTVPGVNSWIGWIEKDGETLVYGVNVLRLEGVSTDDEGSNHYRDLIMETLVRI